MSDYWELAQAFQLAPDFKANGKRTTAAVDIALPSPLPFETSCTLVNALYSKCAGNEGVFVVVKSKDKAVATSNPFAAGDLGFDDRVAAFKSELKANAKYSKQLTSLLSKTTEKAGVAFANQGLLAADVVADMSDDEINGVFDTAWIIGDDSIRMLYNAVAIAPQQVEDRVHILTRLAGHASDATMQPISKCDVISASMKERVFQKWQPDPVPRENYMGKTMLDFFLDSRKFSGDDFPFLESPLTKRKWSYKYCDERSSKIAMWLHKKLPDVKTWGKETVIGLHIERDIDFWLLVLGVWKAGSAYLGLDTSFPADRLVFALEDSDAPALITQKANKHTLAEFNGPKLVIDECWDEIDALDASDWTPLCESESPAYMIYTSGSTGKPKGVTVLHRNWCTFGSGCAQLSHPWGSQMRSLQTMAIAFDGSLGQGAGAITSCGTLVCIPTNVTTDPDRLARIIKENRISFWVTVPSHLATLQPEDVSSIRTLAVAGEACPTEMIGRYMTGDCKMINYYGPTEASVCCTAEWCVPGRPITIGKALPGYVGLVLDEAGDLLPPGTPAELCIAGPATARGYMKRPDLTDAKFTTCKPLVDVHPDPMFHRMYRTGDLVRQNINGDIEFLGRIDTQVKLRGFRIEIEEIEQVLQSFPGVAVAVVSKRSQGGTDYLCAYLQFKESAHQATSEEFDESEFPPFLVQHVPKYMVPQRFMRMKDFLRMPSGKVDRKRLPEPPAIVRKTTIVEPKTETEEKLRDLWQIVFPNDKLGTEDHFFDALGGTSLIAGKLITAMRRAGFHDVVVRNLYDCPTIATFAAHIDNTGTAEPPQPGLPPFRKPSALRRIGFGVVQAFVTLIALLSNWAFLFFLMYLAAHQSDFGLDLFSATFWSRMAIGFTLPLLMMVAQLLLVFTLLPLTKWILLGRVQPGQHWLHSSFFLRWWTVRTLYAAQPPFSYSFMYMLPLVYRLAGSTIGDSVLMPGVVVDFDLITIGDDVYIGENCLLLTSEVIDQQLLLRAISIGSNTTVNTGATVQGGAVIPANCLVDCMSLVTAEDQLTEGCRWHGTPGKIDGECPPLAQVSQTQSTSLLGQTKSQRQSVLARFLIGSLQWILYTLAFAITQTGYFALFYEMVVVGPDVMNAGQPWMMAPIVLLMFPATLVAGLWFVATAIALRWIVMPFAPKAGNYSISSATFHKKLMMDSMIRLGQMQYRLTGTTLGGFYYRCLGLDVPSNCEVGEIYGFTPGLTRLGNQCFFADTTAVNPAFIRGGVMTLSEFDMGERTLVGNNTVVACRRLGDNALVGAATFVHQDVKDGESRTGNPCFEVPNRKPKVVAEKYTYAPKTMTRVHRAMYDIVRFMFGPWFTLLGVGVGATASMAYPMSPWYNFCIQFVIFIPTMELSKVLMLILAKWTICGRMVPIDAPVFTSYTWRYLIYTELVKSLWASGVLGFIRGTQFYPMVLRSLGVQVGDNCYIDTEFLLEPDLCFIGDDCSLNPLSVLQTHVAEDRILQVERCTLGNRVSLAPGATLLPDVVVSEGSTVGPNSIVFKGEVLPERTHWVGLPVKRVNAPSVMRVAGAKAGEGYEAVEMGARK